MDLTIIILAAISIIFGLIILIWPRALNLIVALYLIIIGIIQMVGQLAFP